MHKYKVHIEALCSADQARIKSVPWGFSVSEKTNDLSVLDYLRRQLNGQLAANDATHMQYPTPIASLLGFQLVDIGEVMAILEFVADAAIHGNQQGTVHGGLLSELADAAIGTAHSTVINRGESFTSIDLRMTFLRPVWKSRLRAHAYAQHRGKIISHYSCEITRDNGKLVAIASSTVMTLRGEQATGR